MGRLQVTIKATVGESKKSLASTVIAPMKRGTVEGIVVL